VDSALLRAMVVAQELVPTVVVQVETACATSGAHLLTSFGVGAERDVRLSADSGDHFESIPATVRLISGDRPNVEGAGSHFNKGTELPQGDGTSANRGGSGR
jgi:hypothetical protein